MRTASIVLLGCLCLTASTAQAQEAMTQPTTQPATGPATGPAEPMALEQLAPPPVQPPAATVEVNVEASQRQLWQTHLESLGEYQPSADLQAAMQRIRSIEVRKHYQLPKAAPPKETPATAPASQPCDHVSPQPVPPSIDPLTLAHLKNMPREGVANPSALADTLYVANQFDLAGSFYQLALDSGHLSPTAQAWLIFQLANCRRDSDPAAAAALYERLLSEHAACPWATLARFELNLLRWEQEHQVRKFLQDLKEELDPSQVVLGQEPAPAATKAN